MTSAGILRSGASSLLLAALLTVGTAGAGPTQDAAKRRFDHLMGLCKQKAYAGCFDQLLVAEPGWLVGLALLVRQRETK